MTWKIVAASKASDVAVPQSRYFKNEWKRNHFRLKSMFDDKLDFFGKKKRKKRKKMSVIIKEFT